MRWTFLFLLVSLNTLHGQYRLELSCTNCPANKKFEEEFKDTFSIVQYLREIRLSYLGQGYAEASIDNIVTDSANFKATLNLGDSYTLALMDLDSIPLPLHPRHSLAQKQTKFSPLELTTYLQNILSLATQNGYPLAQVYLEDIILKDNHLSAKIILNKGYYTEYGQAISIGNTGIKNSFIHNYLNINPGKPFNIKHLEEITKRINGLDFMTLTAPPNIRFHGSEAITTLILKEKKANQFNFLIGVLPNNEETKKLLLVGNVLLDFKNMLGYGERFYFRFDQTRPQTQQLELKTAFPYPFNLPVGVDAEFNLYKRDTSFLDVNSKVAVQYFLKSNDYLKFFWKNTSSNLLSINKNLLIISKQLPKNLDYKSNIFGLEYGLENLDYRFNPRKGISFSVSAGGGFIKRPKNPKITEITIPNKPEFSFSQLYDSLAENSWQVQSKIRFNAYIPFFKNSVLAFGNHTGWLYAPTQPRQNELYRIGGNRLLRGFDEESVLGSFYNVSSLEYRLLIGQRSYLFAFGDYGWVQTPSYNTAQTTNHNYIGMGAGMSFETKAGNFRISYALGKQDEDPVNTKSSKIHLGYQSLF